MLEGRVTGFLPGAISTSSGSQGQSTEDVGGGAGPLRWRTSLEAAERRRPSSLWWWLLRGSNELD